MPKSDHNPGISAAARTVRTGRGNCTCSGNTGPGRAADHPGRRRRALVGSGRPDRGARAADRRTRHHHPQWQGPARRATPPVAGPCPLEPGPPRIAARRRHARCRLPVHRGHDRLAADAGSRDADPDRPRPRANRHELPGGRGHRRRRQGRAGRLGRSRRAGARSGRLGQAVGRSACGPPRQAGMADRHVARITSGRRPRIHRRLRDGLSDARGLAVARSAAVLLPFQLHHARLGFSSRDRRGRGTGGRARALGQWRRRVRHDRARACHGRAIPPARDRPGSQRLDVWRDQEHSKARPRRPLPRRRAQQPRLCPTRGRVWSTRHPGARAGRAARGRLRRPRSRRAVANRGSR